MTDRIAYQGKTSQLGEAALCEPVPLPNWFPDVLPFGWQEYPAPYGWDRDYNRVYEKHGTTRVLISCARYGDGKRWLHVSVSRKNRQMPSWDLMCEVRHRFLGADHTAYQVHPPQRQSVNSHPGVLHLWCCVDQNAVLPDFTAGGETI